MHPIYQLCLLVFAKSYENDYQTKSSSPPLVVDSWYSRLPVSVRRRLFWCVTKCSYRFKMRSFSIIKPVLIQGIIHTKSRLCGSGPLTNDSTMHSKFLYIFANYVKRAIKHIIVHKCSVLLILG